MLGPAWPQYCGGMSNSTGPVARPSLASLPSYRPGKPPAASGDLVGYKLSSNENPYPPLPSAVKAVHGAAETFNRYPDYYGQRAVEVIAETMKVPVDSVVLGPGSVGVLSQMVNALCEEGDEVVFAWRSFEAYPIVAQVAGAKPVMVPLTDDGRHDLPAMAAAITERTKLVFVCTPNNPTGTTVTATELDEFLAAVPSNVTVVIDEAYAEFVKEPSVPDAFALFAAHQNVAVLRTFSKAYGLAGLRIGYGVLHTELADAVRKTMVPFSVTNLAQAAAIASLEASDELMERVDALVAERTRVVAGLEELGWKVPSTQGNFVWLPLGEKAMDFAAACAQQGIAVRAFAGEGVRVSFGEVEGNTRFLAICAEFGAL